MILQYDCCKSMHIAYILFNVTIKKSSWIHKDIVSGYLVRYQTLGSRSLTLLYTVAMGNTRNSKKKSYFTNQINKRELLAMSLTGPFCCAKRTEMEF